MDAVTVDGQDTGLQGRTAILDTGTTLIIAPDADAQAVHAAIPGAKSAGQALRVREQKLGERATDTPHVSAQALRPLQEQRVVSIPRVYDVT